MYTKNVANIIQTLIKPNGKLSNKDIGRYGLIYRTQMLAMNTVLELAKLIMKKHCG